MNANYIYPIRSNYTIHLYISQLNLTRRRCRVAIVMLLVAVGPTTAAVDFISVGCKTLTEEDNGGYKLEYKAANTIFKNKNYSIFIYR